jgi:hypothetical protein
MVCAAWRISRQVPFVVNKVGLLQMYRRTTVIFPIVYSIVPLVALVVSASGTFPGISAWFSVFATYVKTILTGIAEILVLLLVLSAAPDAFSTGTVLGVVSISKLFKALAVGLSGISYYLSGRHSLMLMTVSTWAALAVAGVVGAVVALQVRETPRVGTDIPEECLVWEGIFDSESDDGQGL